MKLIFYMKYFLFLNNKGINLHYARKMESNQFLINSSLLGHYMDQRRLKQGLYRHPWDDISYVLPEQYN